MKREGRGYREGMQRIERERKRERNIPLQKIILYLSSLFWTIIVIATKSRAHPKNRTVKLNFLDRFEKGKCFSSIKIYTQELFSFFCLSSIKLFQCSMIFGFHCSKKQKIRNIELKFLWKILLERISIEDDCKQKQQMLLRTQYNVHTHTCSNRNDRN